ncbi:neutral zinc metallopeptidase [Kribbella sp. NPDC049174]|uniref:neutral zinc metallopeptidase n=1 Tax=Kribbella sp. NPDC049174 TaxID=3364112 RepID=UPI003713FAF1
MPEEHPDAEPSSTAGAPAPADPGVAAGSGDATVGGGAAGAAMAAAGAGTARSGGSSPKPGHFLPGGAGDILTDGDRARAAERRQSLDLGKARTLTGPVDPTLRKTARPLPTDPGTEPGFGAPPPAPLAGAPLTPLTGTRRTGRSRPVGWHSPSSRTGAQFSAEPPPTTPPRQYSKAVIAGLSVLTLLLITGGTFAGFKLIDSYGSVDSPMSRPTVRKSEAPLPVPADPTVTVTVTPVPDLVRLRQNKLYTAGKVPSVTCKEPSIKPTSQSAILRYYNALLPCLNKAWAPVVRKAGYDFRPPKIVLQSNQAPTSSCSGEAETAYYCSGDESININWKNDLSNYNEDKLAARVWMMDTLAHEYGHHVQEMTEIITASFSRQGWAKTKDEKLEWSRRRELQASCLAAVFLGANKQSLGLTGAKQELWEWQVQHSGDEYNPKKVRDHGSRKNHWVWGGPAFKSASPASCNTFAAPASKVS